MIDKALFGRRVQDIREFNFLSCQQCAEALPTSRAHLSRVECGHRIPTLAWLEKFAEANKLTLSELMRLIAYGALELDPFLQEISTHVRQISEYNRRIVIEVLVMLEQNSKRK